MAKKRQEKAECRVQNAEEDGWAGADANPREDVIAATQTARDIGPEMLESALRDPVEVAEEATDKIQEHYRRQTVTIEVPIGPLDEGYLSQHIDVQLRSVKLRETMQRIFRGLDLAGARTANARRVTKKTEAMCWLLEQVAAAVDKSE